MEPAPPSSVVSVEPLAPSSPDASRLLAGYYAELGERVPSARAMVATWDEREYGVPRAAVLVARVGGEPAGLAALRALDTSACELKRFWVPPAWRRRGVGRTLLEAIEREAKDLGYRRVALDTAAPLLEAAALYEVSGYRPTPRFNDNPHATAWLAKELEFDDRALWGAFSWSALPSSEWTHEAHLRAAWLHLERWDLDEAHLRMRAGIIRLNAFHGLVETAERGYHETLTRVWLALVREARIVDRCGDSGAFATRHAERLGRDAPLRFFSRGLLYSLRSRAAWCEPDVAALPA